MVIPTPIVLWIFTSFHQTQWHEDCETNEGRRDVMCGELFYNKVYSHRHSLRRKCRPKECFKCPPPASAPREGILCTTGDRRAMESRRADLQEAILARLVASLSPPPHRRQTADFRSLTPWLRKRSPLLRGLAHDVLITLLRFCRIEKVKRDDVIVLQGMAGDRCLPQISTPKGGIMSINASAFKVSSNSSCSLDALLTVVMKEYSEEVELYRSYCQEVELDRSYSQEVKLDRSYCQEVELYRSYCQEVELYRSYSQKVELDRSYSQKVELDRMYSLEAELYRSYCQEVELHRSYSQKVKLDRSYCQEVELYRSYCQEVELYRSYSQKVELDRSYSQKVELDRTYSQEAELDRPYSQEVELDRPYSQEVKLDRPYCHKVDLDRPYSQKVELYRLYSQEVELYRSYCQEVELDRPYSPESGAG
ncbi:hypothetical protein LSAT2_006404 [Lamellibrachia satsuma]|nr:hypothetical protein LSAT2_006404 [Lamellibrachia satsuma]